MLLDYGAEKTANARYVNVIWLAGALFGGLAGGRYPCPQDASVESQELTPP